MTLFLDRGLRIGSSSRSRASARPWLRRNVWRRQSVAAMMTSGQHHLNEYKRVQILDKEVRVE
jgi:hypothetical protein